MMLKLSIHKSFAHANEYSLHRTSQIWLKGEVEENRGEQAQTGKPTDSNFYYMNKLEYTQK